MKKLLFIILFLVPLFAFSQVNKSIVDTTKQWNVMQGYAAPGGWGSGIGTYFYKISSEDTIINENTYNKLLIKYDSSQNANWYFRDWIREETNIVYVYTTYSTSSLNNYNLNPCEYILFDFNLSVGDTFVQTRENDLYGYYMFPSTVIAVDSIEVNGTMLKKITFDFHGEEWIEGIGSANGFLESLIEAYDVYFGLLCVHQGDDLIYQNGYGYSCYIEEGINDVERKNINIKLYPTIVNDVLNIETQDNDIKKLDIIDVLGRVVKRESIYNNKQVNCSQLNTGVYNCIITTQDNKRFAKKFIKQ